MREDSFCNFFGLYEGRCVYQRIHCDSRPHNRADVSPVSYWPSLTLHNRACRPGKPDKRLPAYLDPKRRTTRGLCNRTLDLDSWLQCLATQDCSGRQVMTCKDLGEFLTTLYHGFPGIRNRTSRCLYKRLPIRFHKPMCAEGNLGEGTLLYRPQCYILPFW